jgi:hypothetical protein
MTDERAVPEIDGEETYGSKLSVKTLGCKAGLLLGLPAEIQKLTLCRLFGEANAVKVQINKEDPDNNWTYFVGSFEGINMQTGETLRSGKMFLPKGIQEALETAVAEATKNDPTNVVAFAFEIRAVRSTNKAGYTYEGAAIQSPERNDRLRVMREKLASAPTYEQRQLEKNKGQNPVLPAKPGATAPRTIDGGSSIGGSTEAAKRKVG